MLQFPVPWFALVPLVALALPVRAQTSPAGQGDLSIDIDVVARRLDEARQQIQPSLGASAFRFSPEALETIPQGAGAPLNQVLLRAPGVAQDSFGQVHVRGDHADLQYRLNGVQLPEGLSVFGQAIKSRFARSLTLITGALPAQYGLRTAGIVDIQTKTGLTDPEFELSMTGGSHGWLQPSFSYGGHQGAVDWFVTGDFLHNDIGIENPTGSSGALHDTTNQLHGLAYISGILDPDTRISLILGGFDGQFEIPNNPGQATLGFAVNGVTDFDSSKLNQTQREHTDFQVLSLQKHVDTIDFQLSAYSRYSSLRYSPDQLGDLLFNGIAQQATRTNWAYGIQSDASWRATEFHTLRFGLVVQQETGTAKAFSNVLPVDADGAPTSDAPFGIADSSRKTGQLYGVYIQDEWRILPTVTINGGLRFDAVEEYTQESQVSPRLNVVWKPTPTTTLHVGYARYFQPPPFELVSSSSVAKFLNTTGAPPGGTTLNSTVRAERSHYFDVGISQVIAPGLTVGLDAYHKEATNLIDEGQFGAPIILSAFNYAKGKVDGVELTTSYDRGPWSIYGNVAWSRAMGKDIVSSQFNFSPDDLAYIAGHWIHLDHDQTWTGSAGVAYTLNQDSDHLTRLAVDAFVQSGLRADDAVSGVPNGRALPTYGVVNLSAVQKLASRTELRVDVLNVGDTIYQIRDGSGVGVGAPQFGLRRTILAGVTQRF